MANKNQIPKKLKDLEMNKDQLPTKLPRETRTFGQRAADVVTNFCGSWTFIIMVLTYIFIWISLNLVAWQFRWDPWPFIILNLTLSCLAALQAPIILMSNNRQAERDRISLRYDYLVDRKTSRDVARIIKEIESVKRKLDSINKYVK
jgi:uncharacterized membrane protein